MHSRTRLAALLLALVLLTACSSVDGSNQEGAGITLPSPPLALDRTLLGDSGASVPREVTLYRISNSTMELTTVTRSLQADADGNLLRSVLKELLGRQNNSEATLEDVEFSCGIATVRLSVGANANHSEQDYLLLSASITNTLLSMENVEAVNILIGQQSSSLCNLPMGCFTTNLDNLSAVYAQLQSERERFLGENITPLERTACLYFPAQGQQYFLPELRTLRFPDEDYASELIRSLCEQPLERQCCFSPIPGNLELLTAGPLLRNSAEGERILELQLSPVLANYLALSGVEPWELYGSLVLTLTSFLPELDAVRISLDGAYVNQCNVGGHTLLFPDGYMRRSDFTALIGGGAMLCFVDDSGALVRREAAVSPASALSPQSVLSVMITLGDTYRQGLHSVFPVGIGPEDVLGVAIDDHVATVNLSGNFYSQCQSLSTAQERTLVYAMVNALAELDGIGAVSFLVEGRQIDSLVGEIYLRTALMPNPGLTREQVTESDDSAA